MEDNIAISVKGLSKGFKVPHEKHDTLKAKAVNIFSKMKYTKYTALEDISFDIKKGEFFGIVGKNGCGKSTLLKIIAGIYQPTSGKVEVNGNIAPFIELGVGFNPELTGRENVFLSGTILGLPRKKIEQLYIEIVEFAELKEFMDQKLKHYSSGMQVRLAFSIAVRAESEILLIDEVLAVGDAAFQQKCFNYFDKLLISGTTVCFVTHDMSAIQRFCTKALIIEKGKIKAIGLPEKISDIYREDNMEVITNSNKKNESSKSMSIIITDQNVKDKKVRFKITYPGNKNKDVYVGFSIIKEGNTVAELNSLNTSNTKNIHSIEYLLDTRMFNPGIYEISAVLINKDNKAPLDSTRERAIFIIKGNETVRGGGMRLEENWITE